MVLPKRRVVGAAEDPAQRLAASRRSLGDQDQRDRIRTQKHAHSQDIRRGRVSRACRAHHRG